MSALAVALIGLAALGLGIGAGEWHGQRRVAAEQSESAASLATEVEARRVEVAALTGDLAECRAKVTPESIDATGRVLAAAQASEIADVQLRAAVVQAIPQALYAEAVIRTGSPQSIAAAEALARCAASNATGDSGRSGCGTVIPQAWGAAVARLAECPEPGEGQAPE